MTGYSRRIAVALLVCAVSISSADEGFWPFGRPPIERILAATGVEITPEWLDEARLSVVRVNDAGSGSFVSRSGLIITNHHVVVDILEKLSTEQNDLHLNGFRAKTQTEEMKVDVEVLTLESMVDISTTVAAAMTAAATPVEALAARDAIFAELGAGDYNEDGLWTETSRQNDQYWLYRFRSYDDVRLVFAPLRQAAYFAYKDDRQQDPGQWFDMAILRVYGADGRSLETPHFFAFDLTGGQENESVFVNGFPWKTQRGLTMAQTKLEKKFIVADYYERNEALRQAYAAYAALGKEEAFAVRHRLWDATDTSEGSKEYFEQLSDPEFLAREQVDEQRMRDAIEASPLLKKEFGTLHADIEATQTEKETRYAQYLHRGLTDESGLAQVATALVRYAREAARPEDERIEDLDALREEILWEQDFVPGLEQLVLEKTLELSRKKLGDADPFITAALQGWSPADLAKRVIAGTNLADPAERLRLLDAGSAAILASADPLIQLASRVRDTDTEAEVRKWYNETIAPTEEFQTWMAARMRAAIDAWAAPDADWGLRISYGKVRGYQEDGKTIPHRSRLGEVFELHDSDPTDPDFALDPFWEKNRAQMDKETALNGLADTDIAGGNSGSGLINGARRYVGLVFATNDGQSRDEYEYNYDVGRTIYVDARGILEVLKNGYGMNRIVSEITRDAVQTLVKPPTAVPAGKTTS
ncbi:MAG: hypothetical protein COB53_10640 [Elusimicrobia bacterium]|nr:MAG: hypothetical protein COB53_10640 [Elusimicrobiota bacterium]